MKWFVTLIVLFPRVSLSSLPFITDDSGTQKHKHYAIETFTEQWNILSHYANNVKSTIYGQNISLSYGLTNNLEVTGGMILGYNKTLHATTYSNPNIQLKTKLLEQNITGLVPNISFSAGIVPNVGKGVYYDDALNLYALAITENSFYNDNILIYTNFGFKSSLATEFKNIRRTHVAIGCEIATYIKNINFISESYNGSPTSPRDSDGFFRSYQVGLKLVHSQTLSLHILYGSQPIFMGYNKFQDTIFSKTKWIQIGIRKIF